MEIKVGQIWRHIHTERDWKVIFVGRYDVTLADEEGTFSDGLWKFEKGTYVIVSDSPSSDLEMVQKALMKSNAGSVELSDRGDWTLIGSRGNHITTGGDCQSLLTWAKQTIGEG